MRTACFAVVAAMMSLWPATTVHVAPPAPTVGFQRATIADSALGAIDIGVWYPTRGAASESPLGLFAQTVAIDGAIAGGRLPMVVISHGTGGSLASELPKRPDIHTVPGAGHFVFLAPCSAALAAAPPICHDSAGIDRMTVHAEMNAAVTRFFTEWLARAAPPTP